MTFLAFDDWYKRACQQPILAAGRAVTASELTKLKNYYHWKTVPTIVSPILSLYQLVSGDRYEEAGNVVMKVVRNIRMYGKQIAIDIPEPDKMDEFVRMALGPGGEVVYDVAEGASAVTGKGKLLPLYIAVGAVVITAILLLRRQ